MVATNTATVSIIINAQRAFVWEAVTKPALIKEYFFGTDIYTTWEPGSPIRFEGNWNGKAYEDKGMVLAYKKEEMLQYNYLSSLSGKDDIPENYLVITYRIGGEDGNVTITIIQENIADEKTRDHSIEHWTTILEGLKKMAELKSSPVY